MHLVAERSSSTSPTIPFFLTSAPVLPNRRSFGKAVLVSLTILLMALLSSAPGLAAEAEGTWTKKSQKVSGSWSIVQEGGTSFLVLDSSFKTRSAPDLKLFLSKRAPGDVTNKNATGEARLIAQLEKSSGAQRYELPAGVDLAEYPTLVLHCEKYSKLWAVAAIE